VFAPNPIARFLMSMIYKSETPSLNKLWYGPEYSLLKGFNMDLLDLDDVPILYHNAYNIDAQELELFSNKDPKYQKITTQTLCACSGLPYIIAPVKINGSTYVEGATVDTVGFWHLLQNHPDVDEVWVSRILDRKQIRPHHNLVEALDNLIMMFAATTSQDDVKLFKFHLRDENDRRRDQGKKPIRLVELPVDPFTDYEWTHTNLHNSISHSYNACRPMLEAYMDEWRREGEGAKKKKPAPADA
jgi:predicted acylesterase/phospholipase RssA